LLRQRILSYLLHTMTFFVQKYFHIPVKFEELPVILYWFSLCISYFLNRVSKKIIVMNYHEYKECIDACNNCIAICNHCISSCLQEEDVEKMAECIRLDLECITICKAAVDLMSTGSRFAPAICQICADVCIACADECRKHSHEHCQECADACRQCAEECMHMATGF